MSAVQSAVAMAQETPALSPRVLPSRHARVVSHHATSVVATRAIDPPTLDGRDADEVWLVAPVITEFRQHNPVEDGDPIYRTEARIGYDAKHFYVFVRAYDPSPDSILAFLSRRDGSTKSDYLHVMLDGYHDRRTGVRLATNPLGVKRDVAYSNDLTGDPSWDGVWDVATTVDSLGWTAEFRIPFSQLRYPQAPTHTFGFAIWRDIARHSEQVSWPLYRRSQQGFVSQWGDVTDVNGIAAPRRIEVLPYAVATNTQGGAPSGAAPGDGSSSQRRSMAFGADVKVGVTSNLTLDGSINPDFGQVEADPAQLNLTAFELVQPERRPFFLEGAGTFGFDGLNPQSQGTFYSRRIGRTPQLGSGTNSTILGAAKVTGRTANGLNVGFLNAFTQREVVAGRTIEPATNYLVTRLAQDVRGGNSGVGAILTATNRFLDSASATALRENAYVVGVDGRHRFGGNKYEVSASALMSHVTGSVDAMIATQRSSTHYFHRAGSSLLVDSTATRLSGARITATISRNGGGALRFGSGFATTTPGYEMNDLGFLARADITHQNIWMRVQLNTPTALYRALNVSLIEGSNWNSERQPTSTWGILDIDGQLPNQWTFWTGWSVNNFGRVYDDRASRGGPPVRRNLRQTGTAGFETDARKPFGFTLQGTLVVPDVTGSYDRVLNPSLRLRVASRVQANVGLALSSSLNDQQWYVNETDLSGTHYAFARNRQKTASMTARVDYTMTRDLSLQAYAQPFLSALDYSNPRELVNPEAKLNGDRFTSYGGTSPQDLTFLQFRSTTVLRWEYRPGSVLFLAWQQGRNRSGEDASTFDFGRGLGDLFGTRSDNSFLIKGSYWFSR